MFFHRKESFYSSNLNKYIENLHKGDLSYIPWIFCVFAENSSQHKLKSSQVLSEYLKTVSFDDVCSIDLQMRQTTSMEWNIDWKNLNIIGFTTKQMSEEEKRAVIIFSSFNPNGYIRQQAVEFLCTYEQTLPYIILRLNDWVKNVRESAKIALSERLKVATDEEIISALPFIEKLRRSERCDFSTVVCMLSHKLANNQDILEKALKSRDIMTRRFCITLISHLPTINDQILQTHLKKEKDPFLRKLIFQLLLKANIDLAEVCEQLLRDKYPSNRLRALQYLYEHNVELALQKSEHMIFDKNSNVRIFARNIIQELNADFDFRNVYFENLIENTACCIYGIGEIGTIEDCIFIERYLNDCNIMIIRASMISLMRLNAEKYISNMTEMLLSEYPGIVKTAAMLLKKYRNYDFKRVFEIYQTTVYKNTKIKCASILFLAPKWQCLIYTLLLIDTKHEKLHDLCYIQMCQWINSFNRSFQTATEEEKNMIQELIKVQKDYLNPQIQKQLLFLVK